MQVVIKIKMDALSVIGGIALSSFGVWQTVNKIKSFIKGKTDLLGGNISLLIVGITCIICGIIMIAQHI
jgi:hypothetical protein